MITEIPEKILPSRGYETYDGDLIREIINYVYIYLKYITVEPNSDSQPDIRNDDERVVLAVPALAERLRRFGIADTIVDTLEGDTSRSDVDKLLQLLLHLEKIIITSPIEKEEAFRSIVENKEVLFPNLLVALDSDVLAQTVTRSHAGFSPFKHTVKTTLNMHEYVQNAGTPKGIAKVMLVSAALHDGGKIFGVKEDSHPTSVLILLKKHIALISERLFNEDQSVREFFKSQKDVARHIEFLIRFHDLAGNTESLRILNEEELEYESPAKLAKEKSLALLELYQPDGLMLEMLYLMQEADMNAIPNLPNRIKDLNIQWLNTLLFEYRNKVETKVIATPKQESAYTPNIVSVYDRADRAA